MTLRTTVIVCLLGLGLMVTSFAAWGTGRLPGDHTGFQPEQPIRFSHRLHAGELEVDCMYCHFGAEKSRHAGIPAASVCMNCHKSVTAPWAAVRAESAAALAEGREPKQVESPELAKLFRAVDEERPIEWVRVYALADFVYFDHRPHVSAGVACASCHGAVETMERMRQVGSLSMGWCVDCHRGGQTALDAGLKNAHATTDCAACHY